MGDELQNLAKDGQIFLDEGLNAIPLYVIPAKAGTQIRNGPVDCVSSEFSPCFPVRPPLDPRFRGDDERGASCGGFESQDRKKTVPLDVFLQIEPFNDVCKKICLLS